MGDLAIARVKAPWWRRMLALFRRAPTALVFCDVCGEPKRHPSFAAAARISNRICLTEREAEVLRDELVWPCRSPFIVPAGSCVHLVWSAESHSNSGGTGSRA